MAQQPTAFRLEVLPAANCRLRWVCSLYGFTASGTREIVATRAIYEGPEVALSTGIRFISPSPAPGDDLRINSFQIEPLAVGAGTTLTLTLRLGEIDPANPNGDPLSTKILDAVTLDLSAGQMLQLDATAGGWRIVTKTTSFPLY